MVDLLLEFGLTGKPIIASGWSGHLDFLHPSNVTLLTGELENVHHSAANDWLIKESKWFQPNSGEIGNSLKNVYKKYKTYLPNSRKTKTIC